jgi:hypothetical protein
MRVAESPPSTWLAEMVPAAVTRAMIATESPAVIAWAARHGWTVELDAGDLALVAFVAHPALKLVPADSPAPPVTFRADLPGYAALPPSWTCRHPDGSTSKSAYPEAGTTQALPSSIFHAQGLICAPWNRLAYGDKGGPHSNWGDAANWKTVDPTATKADTLVDMLSCLDLHLASSPGMQQ